MFGDVDGLYDPFRDARFRDVTKFRDGYQNPRPPQTTPVPQYKLSQDLRGTDWNYGMFFVHDEVRDMYFWGESRTLLDNHNLYAQHALTGQRLAPSVDLSIDTNGVGNLVSYTMSPNGRFFALVYYDYSEDSKNDKRLLTVIWRIEEHIKLKGRTHREPWARIVFHRYSNNDLFNDHGQCAVFSDNCHCLSPSGDIDLTSGIVQPLWQGVDSEDDEVTWKHRNSFFCSNGKDLFKVEFSNSGGQTDWRAIKVSLSESTPVLEYSLPEGMRRPLNVSPNGRFLILSEDRGRPHSLSLYDTAVKETIELPCPEGYMDRLGKYHFSKDEKKLILFSPSFVGTPGSLKYRISPCNSYILYFSEGSSNVFERNTTELHLFRIDLVSKSSAKLHVPLPENLISMSANFHPSLPLVSLGYAAASKAEHGTLLDPETEGPQLNLAILELGSSEAQPIGIPERLIPWIKK